MKISISKAGYIVAAAVVAAKNDVRYYLNGILIERAKTGAIIVATDGHRMLAVHDAEAVLSDDAADSTIIQFEKDPLAIARQVKNLSKPFFITQNVGPTVTVEPGNAAFADGGRIIDGTYPDWRRISKFSPGKNAAACYNVSYLADWKTVANYLNHGGNYQAITLRAENEESSAAVFFNGVQNAFGIVMPMREPSKMLAEIPGWAKSKSENPVTQ